MTWTLTGFIAVSTALAATSGIERFANVRPVLVILRLGGVFAVMLGTIATLSNLWSRKWLRDGWQHAGSNPRHFIAGMPPKEEKRSPVQRMLLDRLRKRRGKSMPPPEPLAAVLPPTKKEALRSTAARHARAIDENEQILASTIDNIAASLSAMVLALLIIALGIGISGLFPSTQRTDSTPLPAAMPAAPSATLSPTVPSAPGTGTR